MQRGERTAHDSRRGEGGFTMIELLVALTISVIGLAGMLSVHKGLARGNHSAVQSGEAVRAAESTLEELRQRPLAAIVAAYGELPIDVELPDAIGKNGQVYRRRLLVDAPGGAADLFRTRVEVTWSEGGAEPGGEDDRRVALEVLRTQQETL